jgi:molybdopterin converting factor small subunit
MAVKVLIPPPLRPHAGGQVAAEFPARNVAEALDRLTSEFADLKRHLFTEEGRLRSFVNVYVNGEDIRYLAEERTPTKDGDTINIIPSIAGGNFEVKASRGRMGRTDGHEEGEVRRWRRGSKHRRE